MSNQTFQLEPAAGGHERGHFAALGAIPGLTQVVTTRSGPDFAGTATSASVASAVADLLRSSGLRGAAWCDQVHGATVRRATNPGPAGEGDAIWTDRRGLGILARSADCPLVLLAAPAAGTQGQGRSAVGIAHASWRSTVAGISKHLIRELIDTAAADPAKMVAAICPSAGPCCYDVGEELRDAASAAHGDGAGAWFQRRGDSLYFDLWTANADQLRWAGLRPDNIHRAEVCTMCHHDIFFSHRIQGSRAGRFAALIGLRD